MARPTDAGEGGREPARSEATRQRLLDAALRMFSREGFDATSTRALANAAGVNQAAIPYHFQSKEGLYQAVAYRIVDMVRPSMEPVIAAIREHHGAGVHDLHQAREDVITLVQALLRNTLCEPSRFEIGYFMLREQMHPTSALDILYEGMIEPFHRFLGCLVAALRGLPESDPQVIIEVQALHGEAAVFGAHRTTLARRLGVARLEDGHMEHIHAVVRAMILRQFPLEASE